MLKRLRSKEEAWFLMVLSLGFSLRFYGLDQPQLWLDEIIQIVRFSHPTLMESLYDLRSEIGAVPLDYMIQNLFLSIWGMSEFAARFHAAVLGVVSLLCIYWLGKSILNDECPVLKRSPPLQASQAVATGTANHSLERTSERHGHPEWRFRMCGLFSMFLLAVYPLHVFYSQEGRNYSLFFLLTLSSFYLLIKALRSQPTGWWILFSLTTFFMLYTNYLGLVVVVTQGAFVLIPYLFAGFTSFPAFAPRADVRRVMFFFLSTSLAIALLAPWVLWTHQSAQSNFSEDFLSLGFLARVCKEVSGGSWPLSLLLFLLFTLGARELVRYRQWSVILLLFTWLVLPISIVIFLDWWRGYFFAIRQVLFATPALLLGAAIGLTHLFELARSGRRSGLVLTLILTGVLGLGTVLLSKRKEQADWKALNRYLETELVVRDVVATPDIERVVGFRYRQLDSHKIDMNSLPPRSGSTERGRLADPGSGPNPTFVGKVPRRLHLIQSRYTSPEQLRMIEETLAVYQTERTVEIPGFLIHVLSR